MSIVFQTAINLAKAEQENQQNPEHKGADEYETLYVESHHFEKPLERHKKFQEYLLTVHNGMDEWERNRRAGNY